MGRQAASSKESAAGLGTRLALGTTTRSANVPWNRSDSRERRGSSVSSPPPALASPITPCTTTSLPSASTPAASQPRIIGSRSAGSPTPRSDHTSWWLSAVALTVTVAQPADGSGSGRSPVSRPLRGLSASIRAAYTASMTTTLPGQAPAVNRASPQDQPSPPHEPNGPTPEPRRAGRLTVSRERSRTPGDAPATSAPGDPLPHRLVCAIGGPRPGRWRHRLPLSRPLAPSTPTRAVGRGPGARGRAPGARGREPGAASAGPRAGSAGPREAVPAPGGEAK